MTTININTIIEQAIRNQDNTISVHTEEIRNESAKLFIWDLDSQMEAIFNQEECVNVSDIDSNDSQSSQEDFGILEFYECNNQEEEIVKDNINNEDIMDENQNDETVGQEEVFHYSLVEHDLKFVPNDCSGDLINWSVLERKASKKNVARWVKTGIGQEEYKEMETDLPSIQKYINWFSTDENSGEITQYPVCKEIEKIVKQIGYIEVYFKGEKLPIIHKSGTVTKTKGLYEKEEGGFKLVEGAAVILDGWLINGVLLKSAKDGSSTYGKVLTNSKGVKSIDTHARTGATPSEEYENYDISVLRAWTAQALCREIVDENGDSIGYEFKNIYYKSVFDNLVSAVDNFCTSATFDWAWGDEVVEVIENCIESVKSKLIQKACKRMTENGINKTMQKEVIQYAINLAYEQINMDSLDEVNDLIKGFVKNSTKVGGNVWSRNRLSFDAWKKRSGMFSEIIWSIFSIEKLLVSYEEEIEGVKVVTYEKQFFWSMAKNWIGRKFRQAQQAAWSDTQSPDRIVEHEFELAQAKRARREQAKKAMLKQDIKYYGEIE